MTATATDPSIRLQTFSWGCRLPDSSGAGGESQSPTSPEGETVCPRLADRHPWAGEAASPCGPESLGALALPPKLSSPRSGSPQEPRPCRGSSWGHFGQGRGWLGLRRDVPARIHASISELPLAARCPGHPSRPALCPLRLSRVNGLSSLCFWLGLARRGPVGDGGHEREGGRPQSPTSSPLSGRWVAVAGLLQQRPSLPSSPPPPALSLGFASAPSLAPGAERW